MEKNQSTTQNINVEDLSFEDALAKLEQIVSQLEQGNVPLAQALEIYENGELLKRRCEKLLKAAEYKIEQINSTKSESVTSDLL